MSAITPRAGLVTCPAPAPAAGRNYCLTPHVSNDKGLSDYVEECYVLSASFRIMYIIAWIGLEIVLGVRILHLY